MGKNLMIIILVLLVIFNVSTFSQDNIKIFPREDSIQSSEFIGISEVTFKQAWNISLLSDSTIVVFDRGTGTIFRFDRNGKELNRWKPMDALKKPVWLFKYLRTDSKDNIYITATQISSTLVFNKDGKLKRTIKANLFGENSTFHRDGYHYSISKYKTHAKDYFTLSVLDGFGNSTGEYFIKLNDPPDLLNLLYLETVIINDSFYLVSSVESWMFEFDLNHRICKKIQIKDIRFDAVSKKNAANYGKKRARYRPIFGAANMWGDTIFLSVHIGKPGAEFIEIDTEGNVVNSWYFSDEDEMTDLANTKFRIFRDTERQTLNVAYISSMKSGKLRIAELKTKSKQ